jgi:uncharacterized protein YbbK (DUF523 family)
MQKQPGMRIGISRCLLGEEVRYDGGHKRDPYIVEVLGKDFEWVPVCPEVEIGLGTPRESIQLVQTQMGIRLRGTQSKNDITEMMHGYAKQKIVELERAAIHGFIFKKASPSCGMKSAEICDESGTAIGQRSGMFADLLMQYFPSLPVVDEEGLSDPVIREDFLRRVLQHFENGLEAHDP